MVITVCILIDRYMIRFHELRGNSAWLNCAVIEQNFDYIFIKSPSLSILNWSWFLIATWTSSKYQTKLLKARFGELTSQMTSLTYLFKSTISKYYYVTKIYNFLLSNISFDRSRCKKSLINRLSTEICHWRSKCFVYTKLSTVKTQKRF